jgi:hypothetical protein
MNPLSSKKIGENVSPTKGEVEDLSILNHMEELKEMEASRVVGGLLNGSISFNAGSEDYVALGSTFQIEGI